MNYCIYNNNEEPSEKLFVAPGKWLQSSTNLGTFSPAFQCFRYILLLIFLVIASYRLRIIKMFYEERRYRTSAALK
jgi:hypothetical protein